MNAQVHNSPTFSLFKKRQPFLDGMASIFPVSNTSDSRYNKSESDDAADAKALASDWRAVGNDIRASLNNYNLK